MVEIKNNLIRVRCLECKEENFIEIKHIGTEKAQRSLGFEYEHIFKGKLKCSDCNENMKLLITVFEYPKGFINYVEIGEKSCLVMDEKLKIEHQLIENIKDYIDIVDTNK